jgi:hypothetical protein
VETAVSLGAVRLPRRMLMGPTDSGKTQVLKAIERALRDPGESQSLVDLYGLTGP